MKKSIIAFILGVTVTGLTAFTVNEYVVKNTTAEVEQIQGIYIYAKCKPVKEYTFVGTVSGPAIGNHEFDNLVDLMVKKVKKDYPTANALVFDGDIKQTHNTKVSAVKID